MNRSIFVLSLLIGFQTLSSLHAEPAFQWPERYVADHQTILEVPAEMPPPPPAPPADPNAQTPPPPPPQPPKPPKMEKVKAAIRWSASPKNLKETVVLSNGQRNTTLYRADEQTIYYIDWNRMEAEAMDADSPVGLEGPAVVKRVDGWKFAGYDRVNGQRCEKYESISLQFPLSTTFAAPKMTCWVKDGAPVRLAGDGVPNSPIDFNSFNVIDSKDDVFRQVFTIPDGVKIVRLSNELPEPPPIPGEELWSTSEELEIFRSLGKFTGKGAPRFVLKDLEGVSFDLDNYRKGLVVLEWVNYNCPVSMRLYKSGEMQKLQKEFTKNGGVWFTIYSAEPGAKGYMSPRDIQKMNKKLDWSGTAFLLDEAIWPAKTYRVFRTPFVAVLKDGCWVYAGAPHEQYQDEPPSLDLKSTQPKKEEGFILKNALARLQEGRWPNVFLYPPPAGTPLPQKK